MSAGDWLKEKWQHQEFALPGAEEECVQFVAALMDDTAQILMRSVTITMMACELHDHIVQAFVLEKSPLPLAVSQM